MRNITPFIVMDILERAKELEAQGIDVVHMEVGEPDFPTPERVIEAGIKALKDKKVTYTQSIGIPELRERISEHYKLQYNLDISPSRIVITPGSSPALLVAVRIYSENKKPCGMADPGYPCYKNMARFLKIDLKPIPVEEESGFKIDPKSLEGLGSVVINSPANPTGGVYEKKELEAIVEEAQKKGIKIISDEIYHGITYANRAVSVLELTDDAIVVNGFSKFFLMTGWRLGWMVVPDGLPRVVQSIVQNLFICPPAAAQYAALECFEPEVMNEYKKKVKIYKERRDFMLEELNKIGLLVQYEPKGAFYIYANASAYTHDSYNFAKKALEEAKVGITPGVDFGDNKTNLYVRFSYANTLDRLKEGIKRLGDWLSSL